MNSEQWTGCYAVCSSVHCLCLKIGTGEYFKNILLWTWTLAQLMSSEKVYQPCYFHPILPKKVMVFLYIYFPIIRKPKDKTFFSGQILKWQKLNWFGHKCQNTNLNWIMPSMNFESEIWNQMSLTANYSIIIILVVHKIIFSHSLNLRLLVCSIIFIACPE